MLTPLSYYFEYDNIDSGYLVHTYSFLVSIPIIQTAREIRKIGTINLVMTIEYKEIISLSEERTIEASKTRNKKKSKMSNSWKEFKSYKRVISLKEIKGISIPEANLDPR